jgi:hypothetical protein
MLRRRPSPALVIACIALFVSLSGVSYGVATGFIDSREIKNNTVSSADVRNNALRTFDIRNNEVRGFDIRNSSVQGRDLAFNTVTGADVNETSLGKVPAATAADSATALPALKLVAPTTVAEAAAAAALAAHGPLTLTADCVDQAGNTVARIRLSTTEAGSAGSDAPVLGPGDGTVTLASLTSAGGLADAETLSAFGTAPSGKSLTAQLGAIVDPVAGTCRFNGQVVLQG